MSNSDTSGAIDLIIKNMHTINISTDDFDVITFLFGIGIVVTKTIIRYATGMPPFDGRRCTLDFINGCSIVPFFLLTCHMLNENILPYVTSLHLEMTVAGFIGFVFCLRELSKSE